MGLCSGEKLGGLRCVCGICGVGWRLRVGPCLLFWARWGCDLGLARIQKDMWLMAYLLKSWDI